MTRSHAKNNYSRLSLRISDMGSKVITKIVRGKEGEPGDEATPTLITTNVYGA